MSFENSRSAKGCAEEALVNGQPMIASVLYKTAAELAGETPSTDLLEAHRGAAYSHVIHAARDAEDGLTGFGIAVGNGMVSTQDLVFMAVEHAHKAAEVAEVLSQNDQLSAAELEAVKAESQETESILFQKPPKKTLVRKLLSFVGVAEPELDDLNKVPKSREDVLDGVQNVARQLIKKLQQPESVLRTA